jgi:hypothetical protein
MLVLLKILSFQNVFEMYTLLFEYFYSKHLTKKTEYFFTQMAE